MGSVARDVAADATGSVPGQDTAAAAAGVVSLKRPSFSQGRPRLAERFVGCAARSGCELLECLAEQPRHALVNQGELAVVVYFQRPRSGGGRLLERKLHSNPPVEAKRPNKKKE